MRVAALQMVSSHDVEANLDAAAALIAQAADQGAELVALPEYFCLLGQHDSDKLQIREQPGAGLLQDFLAAQAQRHGIWLVGGTIPMAPPQITVDADSDAGPAPDPDSTHPNAMARARNSVLVFAPNGSQVARYDKMHLFRFDNGREAYDESRVLQAGTTPALVDVTARDGTVWRLGLSVCYDLRFPELYRHYAQAGAQLLLVPSAFTHTTGQAHWEVLLRARAIENLAYVLAPAQGGLHSNGRRTWGHSLLADPWGRVVQVLPEGPGVVCADLDQAALDQARQQLPALQHRQL
jgi:deaminated glutathione amidase